MCLCHQAVKWYRQKLERKEALAPYPWSCSISWCLDENLETEISAILWFGKEFTLIVCFVLCCGRYCQVLSMVLTEVGIGCVALHSMIPQRQRLAALTKFKSSRAKIMVATDVGSRYVNRAVVGVRLCPIFHSESL